MATTVNIHEAKPHLSRPLKRVQSGERIIIANAGKPVADLGPLSGRPKGRIPGIDKGRVVIHEGWNDPLPKFAEHV